MALTKAHSRMIEGSTVNVVDFGAVGDGVTDDTAAIQAALAYSISVNASLYLPSGTYLLLGQQTIASGTKIIGDGIDVTILKLGNDSGSSFLYGDGIYNVTIKNLTIDTDKANQTSLRTAVNFNFTNGGSNFLFDTVKINGSTSAGIICDRSANVVVKNCEFVDCVAGDCLRVSNTNADDLKIINNRFHTLNNLASNRRPIQVGTARNFLISGNVIQDAINTFAIDIGASIDGVISDNVISDCLKIIDIEANAKNILFVNNTCKGVGNNSSGWGVYILENPSGETVNGLTIAGNTIREFWHGIRLEGAREVTVSGNTIIDCWGAGITTVDGTISSKLCDNITIVGNTVNNCSKSGSGSFDGINVKADRSLISGNHVRGSNHNNDISTNSANTLCHVGINYAVTVNRGEAYTYNILSNRRIYESTANPESYITASTGDLCIRDAGTTSIIYLKHTGDNTNTGWKQITHSSAATGGSGSAGAGNQYIQITVGNTTYKVLHDGTV